METISIFTTFPLNIICNLETKIFKNRNFVLNIESILLVAFVKSNVLYLSQDAAQVCLFPTPVHSNCYSSL